MKTKQIVFLILILNILDSCVPYKDIIYLQGDLPEAPVENIPYKLREGDILFITIKSANETINQIFSVQQKAENSNRYGDADLYFNGYEVDQFGFIEVPIIGRVQAQGKTLAILKQDIRQKLLNSQFKNLDDIYIKVQLAGVPYTIMGEVKNPQTNIIYKENPTVLDAISNAKDITDVGNLRKVTVIRKEFGKRNKVSLDLTVGDVVTSSYFYLRPNDIIYVEPLPQKVIGTGTNFMKSISSGLTVLSFLATIILFSNYVK